MPSPVLKAAPPPRSPVLAASVAETSVSGPWITDEAIAAAATWWVGRMVTAPPTALGIKKLGAAPAIEAALLHALKTARVLTGVQLNEFRVGLIAYLKAARVATPQMLVLSSVAEPGAAPLLVRAMQALGCSDVMMPLGARVMMAVGVDPERYFYEVVQTTVTTPGVKHKYTNTIQSARFADWRMASPAVGAALAAVKAAKNSAFATEQYAAEMVAPAKAAIAECRHNSGAVPSDWPELAAAAVSRAVAAAEAARKATVEAYSILQAAANV